MSVDAARPGWRQPLGATLLLALGFTCLSSGGVSGSVEGGAGAEAHAVHVDAGSVATSVTRLVRVERGDTFSEIAQRHLGSARRTAEVQRLNPKVDARALRVGQPLLLPPRSPAKASGWIDLFAATRGGVAQPVSLDGPALLPLAPLRIFAVPHERVAALRASGAGGRLTESALASDPNVARSEPIEARGAEGRPLARAVSRLRVTALEGARLQVAVLDQQLYSASGHRVPAPAEDAETGPGLAVPLLLVLAGLVVFALVALAARRMHAVETDDPGTGPA